MEEETNLAEEFGASDAVASEVQVQEPERQQQPVAQERPPQQQQLEDRGPSRVPLSELLSEREKRQELERQLRALQQQPKPEAKGFNWENPEDSIRSEAREITREAIDPVQQSLQFNNRLVAGNVFGKDVVETAEKAFNEAARNGKMDPATHARINGHPNPYYAAVEWHRQQQVLEKTGGDLTAYEAKLLEDKLKDPEFLEKAFAARQATQQQSRQSNGQFGAKPTTLIQPPRSLSRATGSSSNPSGDVSDEDLASAFGAAV